MTLEQETLRAVSGRLIPFLFILYVVSFLDRVNVGFAALEMNRALNLSPAVYGFGAGIFFIGYSLFEVPSNLILARVGARRWIARARAIARFTTAIPLAGVIGGPISGSLLGLSGQFGLAGWQWLFLLEDSRRCSSDSRCCGSYPTGQTMLVG